MLVDASELPWTNDTLGEKLSRTEALVDAAKADVFAIVDVLVGPRWPW